MHFQPIRVVWRVLFLRRWPPSVTVEMQTKLPKLDWASFDGDK